MIDICERRVVHCPKGQAARYLAAFFDEYRVSDGTVRIALHSPITKGADRRPLVERPVIATLYQLGSGDEAALTYSVTWLPKGDGPSPEFAGALAVERSRRSDCFGLVLSGRFTPLNLGGRTPAAGPTRRFARVRPHEVLKAIADYVERARAHSEAALAGHLPQTSTMR